MNQKRVLLWAVPRSLSTAFVRCMEGVPKTKVIFEPYSSAYHFGPERNTQNLEYDIDPRNTFQAAKDSLEQEYPNADLVFVKDMGYAVEERYHMIGNGYQHTFLIRHPAKAFVSYNRCINEHNDGDDTLQDWLPSGYCYKELVDLYEYLVSKGEKDMMIIDADDLLEDPALMISSYCRCIGVDFSDAMLKWGPGKIEKWSSLDIIWDLNKRYKWMDNSMKAGKFEKTVSKPLPAVDDMPADVIQYIEASMPYYEHLYKLRKQIPQ